MFVFVELTTWQNSVVDYMDTAHAVGEWITQGQDAKKLYKRIFVSYAGVISTFSK